MEPAFEHLPREKQLRILNADAAKDFVVNQAVLNGYFRGRVTCRAAAYPVFLDKNIRHVSFLQKVRGQNARNSSAYNQNARFNILCKRGEAWAFNVFKPYRIHFSTAI